jgi:hypothetical protein
VWEKSVFQLVNINHSDCTWGDISYIVKKKHSDATKKFSETDIINMLEILIDNIFVIFGGRVFQQTVLLSSSTCSFIRVLQNKICPFLAQGICIYIGLFFNEAQLDQLP